MPHTSSTTVEEKMKPSPRRGEVYCGLRAISFRVGASAFWQKRAKGMDPHPAFRRGLPSSYYPSSNRLNFYVRMGIGAVRLI